MSRTEMGKELTQLLLDLHEASRKLGYERDPIYLQAIASKMIVLGRKIQELGERLEEEAFSQRSSESVHDSNS